MTDRPGPRIGPRARLAMAGAVACAMAAYCAFRLQITTDITHFLPAGTDHRLAQVSRALSDSTLTRTLILALGAPDPDKARAAAAALATKLETHAEVAWVQRGPTDQLAQSVYQLYASRLTFFVSDHPDDIPRALDDEGLARAARALKQQLSLPTSPLIARLAGADPLQWFPAILRRFEQARAGQALDVEGDQLVTRDRSRAIVFLGTRHSPFDSAAQGPLLADIRRAFDDINRKAGGRLVLETGGVAPIAVDAERHMRGDLTRISVASTAGVILMFLLLFGSPRMILLAFLPVIAGALAATTVGLLLFGRLHAITLTIGSTLLGVAIDYPILFLTHRVLAPDDSPGRTIGRIWMGIVLGGLTTVAGFVSLAWTSFPGVREMAVTSAVGIAAALLATRIVLPPLLLRRPAPAPRLARGAAAMARAVEWVGRRKRLRAVLLAAVVLVCAVGLPRLRFEDSMAALNAAGAGIRAETERVRGFVSSMDEGRFIIAIGRDEEEALRFNDQIADRLVLAEKAGDLAGWTSLHAFLWSADLQRRNREAVAAAPNLAARVRTAMGAAGFKPTAFAAFDRTIGAAAPGVPEAEAAPPPPPPLRLADLQASPLAPLVRPFTVKLGNEVGILTFVRGIRHLDRVEAAIAPVPGARFFDQGKFLNETYARFRVQILQALVGHLFVILALLGLRYRRWSGTLAAFLPAVLAAAATLAMFGAAGVATNLFHVMSLLLVLSMGVDYGVFLVESRRANADANATLISLGVSCLATVLSFGLLAVSATPALRAIGLITGVGVILSLVLAPLALVITRAWEKANVHVNPETGPEEAP
ncbi:MAG: MMPL family transporter [Bacteroidota bacterium]